MGLLGDPIGGAGRWALRILHGGARLTRLGYSSFKALFLEAGRGRRLVWKTFLLQVYFTAVQALPLLTVASLCVGAVIFLITAQVLGGVGLAVQVRPTADLILRELMPLITILVIIGRSGTAMATELGTMKVDREDEILDSMGINLDYFVILPRIVGMVASLLILNLYVFGLSVLGGEWLARRLGLLSEMGGWGPLMDLVGTWDFPMIALKSVLFGGAVSLLSCYYGLAVRRAPTEVPKMATRGVITAIFVCLILNLVGLVIAPGSAWDVG